MKAHSRREARRLRSGSGLPLRVIAQQLGASVSSVSRWTRDIQLTDEQLVALRHSNRLLDAQRAGSAAIRASALKVRLASQMEGRALAKRADPLHLAGCMLFWAEGSKERNHVAFTNSDPDMVALFVRFLQHCYGVRPELIRLSLNCHTGNGLVLSEIERFWLQRLGLPEASLRAHTVNTNSKASRARRRTLQYGTARVFTSSTAIVQSIYGAIQEYAGIERIEWLD